MKVVILCGGQGTRIRDVADDIPKPMIPIGRYPVLKHIMDIYGAHGFHEFVMCLGYKGRKIKDYFLNYQTETKDITIDFSRPSQNIEFFDGREAPPWNIILAETGLNAMTGCRIKRVQKYVGNEPFMLTYGDGLGSVDIGALLAFHEAHGKLATITSVRPPSRFGELMLDGDRVTSFQEKPQTADGFINGGFFVCEPGVFDYLSEDEDCTFERKPLQQLARDGELMTFEHEGFWMPMDTAREHQLLNRLWDEGDAPWLAS